MPGPGGDLRLPESDLQSRSPADVTPGVWFISLIDFLLFRLQKFEIPRAVSLISEPWTPESGLITAAMKLKRKVLEATFSNEITDMYLNNNNLGFVNNNIKK